MTRANPLGAVTVHSGLQSLAENTGGLFMTAFLVKQGVSQPLALAAFAALVMTRFAMRPVVLPLAVGRGLRAVVLMGIVVRAMGYVLLGFVTRADGWMVAYVLAMGLGSVLYWTAWHAYNAAIADHATRGQQVSLQQAASAGVAIVAPVLGGLIHDSMGPVAGFALIAAIQLAAAWPLWSAPDARVAAQVTLDRAVIRFAQPLYCAEGLHSGAVNVVWNLALFVSLGERFGAFGGTMALSGACAAVASLLIGRRIDAGQGRAMVPLAYGCAGLAVLIKAVAWRYPVAAIAATALGALVTPITQVALLAPLYVMAHRSACPLRFAMATEAGWDFGCAVACLLAAGALALGASYTVPILAGLIGVATVTLMLARWYARTT
ncbi:MFS transporter [Novosphingobium sp. FSW06-99]|uniref:MFS transporter n=1 Tax=Novosphingobium sp. FSW06-99 TaxID=1739113 RepID=UPI000A444B3B|nr:MFS transporter [Novosphingobium sp. FSW06-99]